MEHLKPSQFSLSACSQIWEMCCLTAFFQEAEDGLKYTISHKIWEIWQSYLVTTM